MTPPNDWLIKKCLVLSGSLLLAVWGLIGLGALGLDIPVLRQIVAFIFLTFIPGILLLRILRVHNVHIIESLLYSVGLSLAFVMTMGVIANFALPPLGISHPITLAPLTATFTVLFLILCLLAYTRDKNFRPANPQTEANEKPVKAASWSKLNPYMLAVLLPLLAILGANLVNAYYNNTLIFALIFVITIIIGLVAFNKFIHPRVYPFMIFMMALALLYQTTLISSNLVGSDIHLEYYLAHLVKENGYWDHTIPIAMDSCLSIVMATPIYSFLLNMDIVWLFKVIFPLLFSLIPLALFYVFCSQIDYRRAFFATAFFMSMPMFSMDMAQLVRQQVAELFFVLTILLMIDRKLTLTQRIILVTVFSLGIAVSYYGMGTGYIAYLTLGALVLLFIKSRPGRALWQRLIGKSNSLPEDLNSAGAFTKKALAIIVGIYLAFTISFYGVTASGANLNNLRLLINIPSTASQQMAQGIQMPPEAKPPGTMPPGTMPPGTMPPGTMPPGTMPPEAKPPSFLTRFPFLDPLIKEPLTQTALGLDFIAASTLGKIWRVLQYLVELCLISGFIRFYLRPKTLGLRLKAEYISLITVSVLALVGVFVLPTSSYGFGVSRVWQITLLLTAPLFLLGGETIGYGIVSLARIFRRRLTASWLSFDNPNLLRLPVLFVLLPYFIFNSGVVFELSRSQTTYFIDIPYSIALSSCRVDVTTTFTKQDTIAGDWLSSLGQGDYPVYVDHHSVKLVYWQLGLRIYDFPYDTGEMCSPSYSYLRTWNTQKRVLTFATCYAGRQSVSFDDLPRLVSAMDKSSRIYNNGSAEVWLKY